MSLFIVFSFLILVGTPRTDHYVRDFIKDSAFHRYEEEKGDHRPLRYIRENVNDISSRHLLILADHVASALQVLLLEGIIRLDSATIIFGSDFRDDVNNSLYIRSSPLSASFFLSHLNAAAISTVSAVAWIVVKRLC